MAQPTSYWSTFFNMMTELHAKYENFRKSDQYVSALNTGSAACAIASGLYGSNHSKEPYATLLRELPDLAERVKRTIAAGSSVTTDGDDCPVQKVDLSQCITFRDIVGLQDAKLAIEESIIKPLEKISLYTLELDIAKAGNILLYGFPGVGKTYIVKAALNTLQTRNPFIRVFFYAPTMGQLKGKYVGESEKNIEAVFRCASKQAKECEKAAPSEVRYISVIFLDEIDAIGGHRSKNTEGHMADTVNALLQQLDGLGTYDNVFVIAATNYPWELDPAVLRRFTEKIHIELPRPREKLKLFRNLLTKYWFKIRDLDAQKVIKKPDPCSVPDCGKKKRSDSELYNIWKLYNLDEDKIYNLILNKTKDYSNSDLNSCFIKLIRKVARRAEAHGKYQRMTFKGHTYYVSTLNWESISHLQKTEGTHANDGSPDSISTKPQLSDSEAYLELSDGTVLVNVQMLLNVHSDLITNLYEVFVGSNYALENEERFDIMIKFKSIISDTNSNLPPVVVPIYFYIPNWNVSNFTLKETGWWNKTKKYGGKYAHVLPYLLSEASRVYGEYNMQFFGGPAKIPKSFLDGAVEQMFVGTVNLARPPREIVDQVIRKLGIFEPYTAQVVQMGIMESESPEIRQTGGSIRRNTTNNAIKAKIQTITNNVQPLENLLPKWNKFVCDRLITTDFRIEDIVEVFDDNPVKIDPKMMTRFIEYKKKKKVS